MTDEMLEKIKNDLETASTGGFYIYISIYVHVASVLLSDFSI